MSDKFPDVVYLQIQEGYRLHSTGQISGNTIWCQKPILGTDIKYLRAESVKQMDRHTRELIAGNAHIEGQRYARDEIVKWLIWKDEPDLAKEIKEKF